jgi:hypothetical protein
LHTRQQQLRLGQGQPKIGDVSKTIRPADLHEVCAWILTLGVGLHQPQNPCHASAPGPRSGVKIPNSPRHPQFRGGPPPRREDITPRLQPAVYRCTNAEPVALNCRSWQSDIVKSPCFDQQGGCHAKPTHPNRTGLPTARLGQSRRARAATMFRLRGEPTGIRGTLSVSHIASPALDSMMPPENRTQSSPGDRSATRARNLPS